MTTTSTRALSPTFLIVMVKAAVSPARICGSAGVLVISITGSTTSTRALAEADTGGPSGTSAVTVAALSRSAKSGPVSQV